MMNMSSLHFKC